MSLNFAIFAGKELGYKCLNFLIKSKNKPTLVIINDDDSEKTMLFISHAINWQKNIKLNQIN